MENQRNLILAIALSVAILIGFQYFFEHPKAPAPQPAPITEQSQPAAPGAPAQTGTTPQTGATPQAGAPTASGAAPSETREQALAEAPRIKIDTPRLHGS